MLKFLPFYHRPSSKLRSILSLSRLRENNIEMLVRRVQQQWKNSSQLDLHCQVLAYHLTVIKEQYTTVSIWLSRYENLWNSVEQLVVTFSQVHYPSDPLQPGPIYFLTPRKCAIFGVCCEAIPRQVRQNLRKYFCIIFYL